MIVLQLLEKFRTVIKTVKDDRYIVSTVPVENFSLVGSVMMDYVSSNDNLAGPLANGLVREKVFKTLERMRFKPIEN